MVFSLGDTKRLTDLDFALLDRELVLEIEMLEVRWILDIVDFDCNLTKAAVVTLLKLDSSTAFLELHKALQELISLLLAVKHILLKVADSVLAGFGQTELGHQFLS